MVEDVAGVPVGDQFIEPFVLDPPAVVAELEDDLGWSERGGQGRRPIPLRADGRLDGCAGDLFSAGGGFIGVDDAQRGWVWPRQRAGWRALSSVAQRQEGLPQRRAMTIRLP